jgi:hypothetical protein
MSAHHIVDGALAASERSGPPPSPDQAALLREIARRALWHIPNSREEVRKLVKYLDIENLRQPNPFDDERPAGKTRGPKPTDGSATTLQEARW